MSVPSFLCRASCRVPSRTWTARRFYPGSLPRPPPPTAQPVVETFSEPSRPRAYYARPPPRNDLPVPPRRWPLYLLLCVAGLSAWAAILVPALNREKLTSSIVCEVLRIIRDSAEVRELLGERVHPQPVWWLNGEPWVGGSLNMLRGNVDLKFRIEGNKGAGTLYFTSVRKAVGQPFEILRFKVIADDAAEVQVPLREVHVAERKL